METAEKIPPKIPPNFNQSSAANLSRKEIAEEVALKILLLGGEISVAVGTFYLFTERYLIVVLPHLTPWHLTVTCIGVNLLALVILGLGIHWIKDQITPFFKNHSSKIKVVSKDLIKACVVGCLTRIAKSLCTHENPTFSYKGIGPISLEAAAITAAILFAFMRMQRTGNGLYEHTEIPELNKTPAPAPEQPLKAPDLAAKINESEKIIETQKAKISSLTEENNRLQKENSTLNSARDQQASKQSQELSSKVLLEKATECNKVLEQEIAKLKEETTSLKKDLERQNSNDAIQSKKQIAEHLAKLEQTSSEAQDLTKSFTFMDKESPLKTLQENFKKLQLQYDDLYSEYRALIYSRLHFILQNKELIKEVKALKAQLAEKNQ